MCDINALCDQSGTEIPYQLTTLKERLCPFFSNLTSFYNFLYALSLVSCNCHSLLKDGDTATLSNLGVLVLHKPQGLAEARLSDVHFLAARKRYHTVRKPWRAVFGGS